MVLDVSNLSISFLREDPAWQYKCPNENRGARILLVASFDYTKLYVLTFYTVNNTVLYVRLEDSILE